MEEKITIKNRESKRLVLVLELVKNQKGLVFVMHGLGGSKDQKHIKTFSRAFIESGYSTVRFDVTHTFGESEGNYEDATITNYYEDLEDIIKWAKSQRWYEEPFCLVGHSLGGISVALYAENYPTKVKALAPISVVVSGKLSMEVHKKEWPEWKRNGWMIKESSTKPGLMKKLKWAHFEDRLKYNLLDKVENLTMPVLLIVGEKDESTPPKHQKILYKKLPGKKELHIIKNAPHTFKDEKHLEEIKKIFLDWIKKIN
ncbi:MAG: alpha/beta fold hydrolase [Candidatus Nanoarchaeia archaeon]|nr:alpha/beta fold hydrolase [Candidatus Nanoarchaeia archaeon]